MILELLLAALLSAAEGKPIVAHWGTRDTVLSPRQTFRFWVNLTAPSTSAAETLPRASTNPRIILSANGKTIQLPGDLDFGAGPTLTLRPHFSYFAYALSYLWTVSGDQVPETTDATLRLEFDDARIKTVPETIAISLTPVENHALEAWFARYDSTIQSFRGMQWQRKRKPSTCSLLGPAFDSLESSGKLTGAVAGSATFFKMQMCHEKYQSRDFILTPSWPEFSALQLCYYREMRLGADPKRSCREEDEKMNAMTRKILHAREGVRRKNLHLLISSSDTIAVSFPHYR